MIFRNSVKILFSNFNIVWKLILYFLFVFLLTASLLYLFVSPIIKMIVDAGFLKILIEVYYNFMSSLNLTQALESLSLFFEDVFVFVVQNMAELWPYFLGIGFVALFLNLFMFNLSNYAICGSLNYYMGSLTKHGFFSSFKETFGQNVKMQLCYYITILPLRVLYVFLFCSSLILFRFSWIISLVGVFVLIIGLILLLALKYCLFATWIPTKIVTNYGVWKSFRFSLKMVFKKFGRVFGGAVGVVLTIFVLNVAFGLFTVFAGLIVSIPISFVFVAAFGMVVVYECQGMRYYVDIYNVITPKKKEAHDKFRDMKYIV